MKATAKDMHELPQGTPVFVDLASEVRALRAELRRQKASATENARLYAQTYARLRELTALNRVSRAIISTLDVQEMLQMALQQIVQASEADIGSIMLLEPGATHLRIAVAHGLSPDVVESASVRVGDGLSGWVAKHRKPLLVPNVHEDGRFRAVVPREDVQSAICVPILTRYEALGVVNVARSTSARPFSMQDLQLMTTMAGQVSLAVENARLFEAVNRRNEELSFLMDMAHQLNVTLNLREVLDIIVDEACLILRADAGAVFLLDDRHDTLRVRATRHLGPGFHRGVRCRLGHGLIGGVAVSGAPAYEEDLAASRRLEHPDIHAAESLRSILCAPLRVGGHSLGAVAVYTKDTHRWGDHEINMLMALTGQGAMAVHNAQNYQYQRGIAELVQRNLLPDLQLGRTDLDVGHRYLPAKQVGGDYYDVFHLQDGRLAMLMADVAGKSVKAAVHTAKGKYFIRALGYTAASPADVMLRANTLICADTHIETFISAFYAVLEADGRTIHYCNAGHPPPLLVRADGEILETGRPDILLGILPDSSYTDHTITMAPGDSLVMVTDGVTEARSADGMYGVESLCRCLRSNLGAGAQEMADRLVHDVLSYTGTRTRDDIAVLVIHVPPQ